MRSGVHGHDNPVMDYPGHWPYCTKASQERYGVSLRLRVALQPYSPG
jgi:hypothetical protein